MNPSRRRLAVVCAGQGEQVDAGFDALRPAPGDPPELAELWQVATRMSGMDWQQAWAAQDREQRCSNLSAQRAVVLLQLMRWLKVRDRLTAPAWIVGYSVGELSAHAIAGSLACLEIPALATARAQAMDLACAGRTPGACLVLVSGDLPPGARARRQAALTRHALALAIRRSASEQVWGGPADAVAAFLAEARHAVWGVRAIDVRVPSHTHWMTPALPAWSAALASATVQVPHSGLLSGISAEPLRSAAAAADSLLRQLVEPICWDDCLAALGERGVTEVLDLGPGGDQSRLLREALPGVQVFRWDEVRESGAAPSPVQGQ